MRLIIKTLVLALALLIVVAKPTLAQNSLTSAQAPAAAPTSEKLPAKVNGAEVKRRNPFASRSAGSPPSLASGPFGRFYVWLMATQQKVHRALAAAVKDLKTGNPLWAALMLGAISFSYGVLHAAGPGHGKAVISSYVLANERTVKRGIALSFLAAAIQGLSALILVGVLVLVLRATSLDIKATEGWIETLSWSFVTLIGIWLLFTQLKAVSAGWQRHDTPPSDPHAQSDKQAHHYQHSPHHHEHGQDHGHTHHPHPVSHAVPTPVSHHHHHDHHGNDCGCGHAHMPTPDQLGGTWSWTKALAVAFSVGIRPCTGAIIVLVFAISQGLMWAGVFATFAMALGTAITVSALAALAVGSRELATRMAGDGSRWGWRIERAAGLGGAVLVTALGAAFFLGSLQPAVPF